MPWKTMGSPVIVDANILLYAVDEASAHHLAAAEWLTSALNGNTRVGLPWQTLGAFVRISTHPRVAVSPLSAAETQSWIESSAAAALRGLVPLQPSEARGRPGRARETSRGLRRPGRAPAQPARDASLVVAVCASEAVF